MLPAPPTAGPLTGAQRGALVRWASAKGDERKRARSAFDEADFLAGAMCDSFALRTQDRRPAGLIFGTMMGRDLPTERLARRAAGLPASPEAPADG
jgi:hypothetical protein